VHQADKFEKLGWATLFVVATQLLTSSAATQESVRPTPPSLVVRPLSGMQVSGVQGGPFSPTAFQYRLSASSGTVRYAIITPSWLTASSRFDTADTSGVIASLIVQAPPNASKDGGPLLDG
jgi:hypothetical protein